MGKTRSDRVEDPYVFDGDSLVTGVSRVVKDHLSSQY